MLGLAPSYSFVSSCAVRVLLVLLAFIPPITWQLRREPKSVSAITNTVRGLYLALLVAATPDIYSTIDGIRAVKYFMLEAALVLVVSLSLTLLVAWKHRRTKKNREQ